jgi:3-hydroxybutyryl-CoA dehydrogenase
MDDIMNHPNILVVGAGVMGMGIVQVAAQAGHRVFIFDQREGAAIKAKNSIQETLNKLVGKGKITETHAQELLHRIEPIQTLEQASRSTLVIEAIVEKLEAKVSLFKSLETLLGPDAILATNTSSISVTAIAASQQHPERVVGMHFFNPVPLMALVEVVSGLHTSPKAAQAIEQLATAWGKVPVHARSTPGFIVNRIARPYYAEALMLLQEQAAPPQVLDALLRSAGFRMGPCELMDLIGHDTNFSVTQSVFEAYFYDRRFTPSGVQKEMVDGGLLGRKSGRGFYTYPQGAPALTPVHSTFVQIPDRIVLHGLGPHIVQWSQSLAQNLPQVAIEHQAHSDWIGLALPNGRVQLTDGRTAYQVAQDCGQAHVSVMDETPLNSQALAYASTGSAAWAKDTEAVLCALGYSPYGVADTPGLVVARTLAMLVNEAADAVLHGVCSVEGADAAMKLGVNYPAGPFEWLHRLGIQRVIRLIESLDRVYRGERYRVSPWLLQAQARLQTNSPAVERVA